ncbi:hypothetical protein PAMP_007125 [Pampus punctatissimus]
MDVAVIIFLIHLTHTEIRGKEMEWEEALLDSRVEEEPGCPLGQFPCGNVSECLPQALQCNGHKDCPNGADERRCVLQEYPESCDCILTDVECVEVNLQDVPLLSPNVTWLIPCPGETVSQ